MKTKLGAVAVTLLLLAASPGRSAGQLPGRLEGRVVDADDGTPVPAAEIALVPRTPGPEPGPSRGPEDGGNVLARAETDAGGEYVLEGVPPGSYAIRVRRIGYRPVTVDVRVGGGARPHVSVALQVEPIALERLEVSTRGETELRDVAGRRLSAGLVSGVALRQRRFLTSDSRLVTPAELRESPTLGETDVFRAIQRLPGVSTRDDFSAELWIRGASWGETRVYLDRLPLFNPLHGFGVLSGVSFRGVGSAVLHPGVRPVSFPEGAAAVVGLSTRTGLGMAAAEGGMDLSLASAQAWGAGPLGGSDGGWALTARRSYADVVVPAIDGSGDTAFPYDFTDVQGRLDLDLGGGVSVDASTLWEHDALRGEIPDVLQRTRADWGNVLAQAGVTFPVGSYRVHGSVGGTRYRARVREIPGQYEGRYNAPSADPADHRVGYLVARADLAPAGAGADTLWSAGVELTDQASRYRGPEPWPYSQRPQELGETRWNTELVRLGVWGHRRWTGGPVTVDGALRVDAGSATASGTVQASPSLTVSWHAAEGTLVSLAAGRSVQYAQSPAAVGPRIDRAMDSGRLWMLAGPSRAPVVARTITLGAERWLGDAWLASATAYLRHTTDVLLPDPTPGLLIQRPALVKGSAHARGVELSLRKLRGRVTGWVAYSLARARGTALGRTVPTPTDRTHVLDATAQVALSTSWSLNLGYTYASGAPFTRVIETCDGDGCPVGVTLDRPLLRRAPGYASLDAVLRWDHRFGGWSLGFFLQGRNLLGHENGVSYDGSELTCGGGFYPGNGPCPDGTPPHWEDRFHSGIPTLPLLGLRVGF